MVVIVKIKLENEMDLIIAHKRAMKLAELLGLSTPVQTIFATAVSEIARCVIDYGKAGFLKLGIDSVRSPKRSLMAVVSDELEFCTENSLAIVNARRLVEDVRIQRVSDAFQVTLHHPFSASILLSNARVQAMIDYFERDVMLSPYEELLRKNQQLQEMATRLRDSQENYRILTDTLPLMIFSTDQTGHILFANSQFNRFLDTTISRFPDDLAPLIHPEDYPRLRLGWNDIPGQPVQVQARLLNRETDAYIWHMISIVPLKEEADNTETRIGFLVDIHAQKLVEQTLQDNTELKAAQVRLQQYQQELEDNISELNRSNDALEQFAYIASHDLQEPLRKIQTFSDLLTRNVGDPETSARYLDKINSSARRMGDLIRGVLAYSRLSRSEGAIFHPVALDSIMKTVYTDLELLIEEKQAELRIGPMPVVQGLDLHLTQLFINLVGNALKFCDDKPIIEVEARPVSPDELSAHPALDPARTYIEVCVRDNGIGFEPEYSEQIFSIFQRLNDQRSYSGTGIGLALCKKIVENHRGLIMATGEPDQGATFCVWLPTAA